ncbi:IS3 family transposase [Pedobacter sp. SAFR-022]|uniref:IS3 family transposase n=1 Tax=Pedobacter sp. SAFR-022 TaxID=3436861 RepID=UPI003F7E877F
MIAELKGSRPVCTIEHLCEAFGYTRQAWYNHLKNVNQRMLKTHVVLQRIREIRDALPETGCMKLYEDLNAGFLQRLGFTMGRDAVFNLMRENKMLIKPKRRFVRTTNSFHRFKIYPDLVQRSAAKLAEQIWVSDITYLNTTAGFAYLSLVTDAYSRKIMGYYLSKNLKAIGCIKALQKGLNNRLYPQRSLIHHSDRGTQYCCDNYIKMLNDNNIRISMTQTGSPYDNAIAERLNGILKREFGMYETFKTFNQACQHVHKAIYKYNNLRRHASCNYQTPEYTHNIERTQL